MTALRSLSDLKTLFGPEAKARDNKNGAAAEAGRRKEVAMLSNIQCGSQIGNAVIEGHTDIPASPLALIQDGAVRLTAAQAGAILRLTRYERQTRDLNPAGRDHARSGIGVGALEYRSGTGRGCKPGNRTQSRASGLTAVVHEILHPQARHGGDRKSDQVADSATCSFADATAKATGRSARTVRVVAERGNKISDRALQLVAGTHLDTGTFLDKIKDLGPKEQEARVQRELAAERPQRRPVSPAPEPRNEIEAFEAWLARGVKWFETGPEEWRERAREHLYPDVPVMDRRHA